MNVITKSTPDWEHEIGEQVRSLRIANDMDQSQLAAAANLSVGAIKNIENGKGSSLKTLISVVRVLNSESWLSSLAPPVEFSPMQLLRDQNISEPRRKVFRPRG